MCTWARGPLAAEAQSDSLLGLMGRGQALHQGE